MVGLGPRLSQKRQHAGKTAFCCVILRPKILFKFAWFWPLKAMCACCRANPPKQGVIKIITRSIQTTLATLLFLGAGNIAWAQGEPAQAQASSAQLATLKKAHGTVMVDRGKGFFTSTVNATLNDGDRVITLDGSSAEVVFSDGCRSQLQANHMLVISAAEGCKAAIASVNGAETASASAGAGSTTPLSHKIIPVLAGATVFAVVHEWHDIPDSQPISAQ